MLTMRCWIPEPLTLRQYSIASRVLMPPCRRSIDRSSLDFLEPSADRIAMPAQHIEFPTQHGGIFKCIEITCVGILGHKRQRPFFTGAADHDWWMRLGDRQRRTKRFGQSIMLPHIERTFPRPHLQRDLDGLLEALEALLQRWERHAECNSFMFVPASPYTEIRSTARKHVESRHRLHQNTRIPVGITPVTSAPSWIELVWAAKKFSVPYASSIGSSGLPIVSIWKK